MITGGLLGHPPRRREQPACLRSWMWFLALAGTGLVLYAFMADAINASGRGLDRAWQVLPANFDWSLFLLGLSLMAVPVADMVRQYAKLLDRED